MIKLPHGYFIEIDPLNYTLRQEYQTTNKKTGEPKTATRTVGYFTSMQNALVSACKDFQAILDSEGERTFTEYLKSVQNVQNEFKEWLKENKHIIDVKDK